MVLDEADTMFDKGFGPEVRAVLGPLRSKAQPAKAVLVVATLSKACNPPFSRLGLSVQARSPPVTQ